ncbi:MAG: hypothetical protein Q9171_004679 [Xanthocarpia ochracea]
MSLQTGSPWAGGNPPFMQQGTVDWVAFGNTIWSASSAVLQRFAAAGIQPITYGAGIALSSQLHLDRVGQLRMEEAIGSLRSIFGLGKVLWFGFGYQSFVHTMAETVAEIKCLAICSCLAEAHTETLAAWVLSELWRVSAFPEHYEPSHAQFLALVKASAGVVSRSEFGKVLDTMLGNQLWRDPSYLLRGFRGLDHGSLEASNARDIASALHRLFQISRGEADHIVVNGGSECAFIAAIASWLLNLKVRVENSRGDTLLDDTLAGGTVQVFIRYSLARSDTVKVIGTTYLLGSCHEIIGRIPDEEDYPLIVRTPWSSCLARVFGSKFTELSNMPHLLGDYLGGVARVYEALATGASNIAHLSRKSFVNFSEASYGHGFVDTVISTFPELENIDGFRDRMLHVANQTFDDAMRSVESSIIGLESLCSCVLCAEDGVRRKSFLGSKRCIVGVAYAIRRIALVMSCVVQDVEGSGLLPTINGLSAFSALGKQPAPSRNDANEAMKSTSKWTRPSFYWNAFGLHDEQATNTPFRKDREDHLLASPALLFQGFTADAKSMSFSDSNTCTALSRGGICCFIEALRALSPRAETVCKVHVLPGHIQCRDRRYDFVHDAEIPDSVSPIIRTPQDISGEDLAALQQPSTDVPDLMRSSTLKDTQALATERSSGASISFVYKISLPERHIYIRPGELTQFVLRDSGLIAFLDMLFHLDYPALKADMRVSYLSETSIPPMPSSIRL